MEDVKLEDDWYSETENNKQPIIEITKINWKCWKLIQKGRWPIIEDDSTWQMNEKARWENENKI